MDIIAYVLGNLVPTIIETFLPLYIYEDSYKEIFELIYNDILPAGLINDTPTLHVLFEILIDCAKNEEHYPLLLQWFSNK